MSIVHTTVLQRETVEALCPTPGRTYVDVTLGGGGHSALLAEKLDDTSVIIGLDQDPAALEHSRQRLASVSPKTVLIAGNFGELHSHLIMAGYPKINGGLMADLGMSAFQLTDPERGFSFQSDSPLDMRMSPAEGTPTAADLINSTDAKTIAGWLFKLGDEKYSRQIASVIVAERPLTTTKQLAEICRRVYHQRGNREKNINPATRTFQALRMVVNRERENLEAFLEQLPAVLQPGARVGIITFHSGEDRLVKQYFRLHSVECLCPPQQPICTCGTKPKFKIIGKPISPSPEEVEANPQARSAKLRVAERI